MEKDAPSTSVAPELKALKVFGPPPLIRGEDPAAYQGLLARVTDAIKPRDIFEEIWSREIVDRAWEAWRFGRLKANLLATDAPYVVGPSIDSVMAQNLASVIEPFERMDRMGSAAARWDKTLRELEGRRSRLAPAPPQRSGPRDESEQVTVAETLAPPDVT